MRFRRRALLALSATALCALALLGYQWLRYHYSFSQRLARYRKALAGAATADEKQRITGKHWPNGVLSRPDRQMSRAEQVHTVVCVGGPISEVWLLYYPEIVRLVEWDLSHLRRLGKNVGHGSHVMWNEKALFGKGLCATRLTRDEIARGWLKVLTGRDFESEDGLGQWIEVNQARLAWDEREGRFILRENQAGRRGGDLGTACTALNSLCHGGVPDQPVPAEGGPALRRKRGRKSLLLHRAGVGG